MKPDGYKTSTEWYQARRDRKLERLKLLIGQKHSEGGRAVFTSEFSICQGAQLVQNQQSVTCFFFFFSSPTRNNVMEKDNLDDLSTKYCLYSMCMVMAQLTGTKYILKVRD